MDDGKIYKCLVCKDVSYYTKPKDALTHAQKKHKVKEYFSCFEKCKKVINKVGDKDNHVCEKVHVATPPPKTEEEILAAREKKSKSGIRRY